MNKKHKILLLGVLPPPYHGVSVFNELIKNSEVLSNNFDLSFFNTSTKQELEEVGRFTFAKIVRNLKVILNFRKFVKRIKPELVYLPISQSKSGFLRDAFFIYLCNKDCRRIIHLHGGNFDSFYENSSKIFKKIIDSTLKKVDKAIVLGNVLRPLMKKWFNNDDIFVLYNGIKSENFEFKNEKNKDKIIIGYLGNLYKEKGFMDILYVFNELKDKYQDLEFHYAGDWFKLDFKKQVNEYIIENNIKSVFYHGLLRGKDKTDFLRSIDIFVFNSYLNEGQPLVILEAMANGCAIVSTDVGAIRETIEDNVNGFLIKPKNRYELKKRIEDLLKDKVLRNKMAKESLKIFNEKFTFDKTEEKLIKIFNNTLECE